jgi:hypothetical protein
MSVRPAAPIFRVREIDGHEDHRGDEHAAESRDQRKRAVPPGIELPLNHLPLDLKPHQEKEKGHQPIVDPIPQIKAGDPRMQRLFVSGPEECVRHGERERGAAHEQNAARRFGFDEALERRSRTAR